jgi:CDP-4-dehydro-6-deoxyglucose reductase, E1
MKENRRVAFGTITITPESIGRINESLKAKRVSGGKYLKEFEDKFAEFVGVKNAVAVSSGTDALTLALSLLYEKMNREYVSGMNVGIILPALTFVATANAVVNSGFTPMFVDVDKYTLNISYDDLVNKSNLFEYAAGIIPVHLMGNPVDMDRLKEIIKDENLMIIEDAAEAHGTFYKDKMAGSIGDVGCFSTYLAHIISTIDGGVVTTNNDDYAKIIRSLRMHGRNCSCKQCVINTQGIKCEKRFKGGIDNRFLFDRIGYSSRMNDLEAAVGIGCLYSAEEIIYKRKQNYRYMEEGLYSIPRFNEFFYLMKILDGHIFKFSPHAFPIICREEIPFTRDIFSKYLEDNGIETRTLFASIPTQYKAYKQFGYLLGEFPNAEYLGRNGIHIGVHQNIDFDDIDYIVDVINKFIKGF